MKFPETERSSISERAWKEVDDGEVADTDLCVATTERTEKVLPEKLGAPQGQPERYLPTADE